LHLLFDLRRSGSHSPTYPLSISSTLPLAPYAGLRSAVRGLRSAFTLILVVLASSALAQSKPPGPQMPAAGDITIKAPGQLLWEPEVNYFLSPGPVRIIIEDATTHEETVLIADDAEGKTNGDVIVKGNLRVERAEGNIQGHGGAYNYNTREGEIHNATSKYLHSTLTGDSLKITLDKKGRQVLLASHATFTTCIQDKPHYHITAREIRVTSDEHVTAKDITFWLGNMRLISLPSISKDFGHGTDSGIPLPGYSRENWIQIHFRNGVIEEPVQNLRYDIIASLRQTPSGTIAYERDLGHPADNARPPDTRRFIITEPQRTALETTPALLRSAPFESDDKRNTFYALLTSDTFVYNRSRTDLNISRLPEVGFSMRNILNRPSPIGNNTAPYERAESAFGTGFLSPAEWFVNAEAGLGYFNENPTNAHDTRLGTRVDATSPLFVITRPLYIRYGGTAWMNTYGDGDFYTLVSPEFETDYLISHNTLVGAAYRYEKDFGKTPFAFDSRDVTHEMRLIYGYIGPNWAYDSTIKYDMQRLRSYDSVYSVRKRFDCMEFGFAFHTRNQAFSLIFNLLPGSTRAHQ